MISVTVMYPNSEGATFDFDYYVSTHIPLVRGHWDEKGLKSVKVVKGLAGGGPDDPAAFIVIANLEFASMEDFQKCLAAGGDEIMGDIPNFSNVQPTLQVSEQFV